VIPIRSFALGKARLAAQLDGAERAALGQRLAEHVVRAASAFDTVIVSSDTDVRTWAVRLDVAAIDDPGSLDSAADDGRAWLRIRGCRRVVIAHADLPLARTFVDVTHDASQPVVVIVPCHRDDGTPVLSLPADSDFAFAYGAGSFRRHAAEARRVGLAVRVVRDPSLAFDVDVPDDLDALAPQAY